ILDLSKIESGKLKLNYEPISLKLLIQEMQLIFSQKVEAKGLLLWTEIAHNAPDYIIFDEVRLRQILFNVLSNAIKFTETGSIKITVAGRINPNLSPKNKSLMTLEISVTDTGIGIEPVQQKRIFAPFIQSEGQSTRKYGGTGLGLAITKKLTEMLGGKIHLKSVLGKGSKFTFIFYNVEIAEYNSELITTYHPDEDFNKFESSTILIVDDVQSNLDLIAGYFENTHHKLILADDGQKAINQALIERPNLILLDLWMPELNGIDTAKFIRKNPETRHIPIIFITASSQIQDEDMKELSNGFIRKPVSKRQLFAEIEKVLSLAQTPKQINIIPSTSEVLKTAEVVSNTFEEIQNINEVNSSDKMKELLLQLKQEEEINWHNLAQRITRREVKIFYERLMTLGLEYQCQELINYAEQLAEQLADLDFENLSQTVNNFPKFRLELEKKYGSVVRK
ncbi:MAG TPA: ATP-binding protein, partial [Allocoleopsis sp.]